MPARLRLDLRSWQLGNQEGIALGVGSNSKFELYRVDINLRDFL